jgi:hypothetical protein
MAGLGKKTFTAGDVLIAGDVNSYLMDQTVMNFAGTAARNAAIPVPSTGMTTYIGTTGTALIPQIETYTGAAWQTPYGKTLLSKTDLTAATTVTFTNVFSSTYDNYQIVWNGNSSADHFFNLIFGATTTAYYSQLMDVRSNVGGPTLQAVIQNGANMLMGFNWTQGSTTDALISNPFKAATTHMSGRFTSFTGSISSAGISGGSLNNTTSYTACTITPSAGNFTGTFRVYGLRNS